MHVVYSDYYVLECIQCRYQASEKEFDNGCPKCGCLSQWVVKDD